MKAKNIRQFFKEVFGSPEKKPIHVKTILDKYGYKKNEKVFIGDALSDRDAARENGISFIGRYTTTEEIKNEKHTFNDFYQLNEIIKDV